MECWSNGERNNGMMEDWNNGKKPQSEDLRLTFLGVFSVSCLLSSDLCLLLTDN